MTDPAAPRATDPARSAAAPPRAALVVNPARLDVSALADRLAVASGQVGLADPLVLPTSRADAGAGQTRAALAAGVSLVVAAGGDGTVRHVAGVLAGSHVPLALVPSGTANLLARNLDVPVWDTTAALGVALAGRTRLIDLMDVTLTRPGGEVEREPSVVGAGIGFDADLMAGADEELKERLGWLAYVVSGARAVSGRLVPIRLRLDAEAEAAGDLAGREQPHSWRGGGQWQSARSIIVANCGLLTGGLRLAADSRLDDGRLEVVVAAPRRPDQWAGLLGRLVRGDGEDNVVMRVEQATRAVLEPAEPLGAQIDGDPLGEVSRLEAAVRPGSVRVAVPG